MTWTSKRRLRQDNADLRARLERATTELGTARADLDTRNWNRRSAERIANDLITRTGQLAEVRAELHQTQTQLGQARRRIGALTTNRATAWQNAGRWAEQYRAGRLAQAEHVKEGSANA